MKFLKLNAIANEGEGDFGLADDAPELGEDDLPIERPAPQVETMPVTILDPLTRIRSFSPRKPTRRGPRPGTRIVFMSGAGLPVIETTEQVEASIAALYN